MDDQDLKLRTLLADIGDKLSQENRVMLGFLLKDDVPRRDLDSIGHDSRVPMSVVWEALINRQKITPDDVDYLIDRLEKIQRLDLVRILRKYTAAVRTGQGAAPHNSDLFKRLDPWSQRRRSELSLFLLFDNFFLHNQTTLRNIYFILWSLVSR